MGWLKKVWRYFFGAHNHAFVRPLRLVALISIVVFVNEYRAPIDDTIPADAGGTPQSSQQDQSQRPGRKLHPIPAWNPKATIGETYAAAFRDMNILHNLGRIAQDYKVYAPDPNWTQKKNQLWIQMSHLQGMVDKYPRMASAKSYAEFSMVAKRASLDLADRAILHRRESKHIKTSAAALFFLICVAVFLLASHLNKRGGIVKAE